MSEPLPARIEDVRAAIVEIDEQVRALHERERALRTHGDALLLATRPETYPTPAQVLRLREAATAIHDVVEPPSHHGDHLGDGVVVHGTRGFVRITAGAPYSMVRRAGHLWTLTDEEIEATLVVLREAGLDIDHYWRADGGVSFLTVPRTDHEESKP